MTWAEKNTNILKNVNSLFSFIHKKHCDRSFSCFRDLVAIWILLRSSLIATTIFLFSILFLFFGQTWINHFYMRLIIIYWTRKRLEVSINWTAAKWQISMICSWKIKQIDKNMELFTAWFKRCDSIEWFKSSGAIKGED